MLHTFRKELLMKKLLAFSSALVGEFALLMIGTVPVVASSQLTTVSAAAKGNATVVTLHANGIPLRRSW